MRFFVIRIPVKTHTLASGKIFSCSVDEKVNAILRTDGYLIMTYDIKIVHVQNIDERRQM